MGKALKARMAQGFTFLKMDLGIELLMNVPGALSAPLGFIETMKEYKKFEVGKTYRTRSICDNDCIISGKVLKRTASTVTMDLGGDWGVRTLRIAKVSMFYGCEAVKPWGGYSMSPTLVADDSLAA
jgi:hypothetical protein